MHAPSTTEQKGMNPSELSAHWQQQVDEWRMSGLSQRAYCLKHNLKSYQLSYWKCKFDRLQTSNSAPSPKLSSPNLVPLAVSQGHSSLSLCLRFPNGCELSGIEPQHLPLLSSLLASVQ